MASSPRKPSTRQSTAAKYVRCTITIPEEMGTQIVALVGHGKFSAFARRALAHELDGTTVAQWFDERRR